MIATKPNNNVRLPDHEAIEAICFVSHKSME